MTDTVTIREATVDDMPAVRTLFEEYQQWLGVDLCFQGFDRELAELPGRYAPPGGGIFLALMQQQLAGCVAFRPLSDTQAELKRLYVKPDCRGHGLGKALFHHAMTKVEACQYHSIVLDTLPTMSRAQGLYTDHGFEEISAYYPNPEPGVKYYRYVFHG